MGVPRALTNTEVIEQWLFGRPVNTQQAYMGDVLKALHWLGDPPLEEITLGDLQRYQAHLVQVRHFRNNTVRRKISSFRAMLNFAIKERLLEYNPSANLAIPQRTDSVHERILSRQQVEAVIDAAAYDRNHAMLRFLYCTGARASELCGLLWRDCIPKSDGSTLIRLFGKRQKWRSVVMPPEVWREVARLRNDAPDSAKVFRIKRQELHVIFKAAATKAGCPEASTHWFRHSIASHLIEAGMPLPAVRDFLGHKSLETTNIYAHASPEQNPGNYLKL